jgi:hypothetical protein
VLVKVPTPPRRAAAASRVCGCVALLQSVRACMRPGDARHSRLMPNADQSEPRASPH